MSNKIYIDGTIAYRQDSLENWQTKNLVLEAGEPAIVSDAADGNWLKIGDGQTPWQDLPYKVGPKGEKGDKGEQGEQGAKGDTGPQGIQGEKGENGQDYVLTEADKTEIADLVRANFTDVSEVGQ